MIRQFYIENSNGERISFVDKSHFLSQPDGLGFETSPTYIESNKGFYTIVDKKPSQGNIGGMIVFTNRQTAYQDYRTLTKWINAAETLSIVYIPYGTTEYYCDVMVTRFLKSEKTEYGWLECRMDLSVLTPYYSKQNLVFDFFEEDENSLRLPTRFPFRLGASSVPNAVSLNLDGDFDAAFRLNIVGLQNNPVINLVSSDKYELLGQLKFNNLTVPSGSSLIVDTRPNNAGVWLSSANGLESVLDKVDLVSGIESFFSIPKNTNCTFSLDLDNDIQTGTSLVIYQYWMTR